MFVWMVRHLTLHSTLVNTCGWKWSVHLLDMKHGAFMRKGCKSSAGMEIPLFSRRQSQHDCRKIPIALTIEDRGEFGEGPQCPDFSIKAFSPASSSPQAYR